jgi:hypothetical protein
MGYWTAGIAALLVYFAVADAVLRRRGERRRVSRNGRMENEERAWGRGGRNKVDIQARDQLRNRGILIGVAQGRLFESQQSISTRARSGG